MEIVSSYNEILLKAYGQQQIDYNCKYRLAGHTYIMDYNGNTLLYNNISKRLYLLNEKEKTALENLNEIDFNVLKPLFDDWSLVKEDFDELSFAKNAKWLYENLIFRNQIPDYTILTTTNCNARCYYCFQHGQKRVDMTEKTAEDVAEYIIENTPNKKATLKWFGGEPLFNERVIDIITSRLSEAKIKFSSKITTNGYLFDKKMIKKAKSNWALSSVVITLDGTEKIYNRIKNYIYTDSNPFQKVLNNIQELIKNEILVTVRLNVGFNNYEDLKELVLYLKNRFKNTKYFRIFTIGLYDTTNTRSSEEDIRLSSMVAEIEKLTKIGNYQKTTLKTLSGLGTSCMAEMENCKLISPTGELGACEHFSEGKMMYGSIYSDKTNPEIREYFRYRKVLESCKSCVLYGNCGGVSNCPNHKGNCEEAERMTRFRNLDNYIINTYEQYLSNNRNTIVK